MSSITIRDAFAKSSNGKAFVAFVTAGDPSIAVTEELVCAMAEEGVDLIELGIPFSDPTAEGPVIQEANLRALSGAREAEVGMQGIILPDVPFEEKIEFAEPFAKAGLEVVSLIAPTSAERIATIAREAAGFVYCVSSLGVTGVRSEITTDIGAMVKLVRTANPDVPVAVGFGISTPAQAARMAALSDGAITGSAIIKIIAAEGEGCVESVRAYVREMAAAVHGV